MLGIQILTMLYMNLFFFVFTNIRPYEIKSMNKLNIANEYVIMNLTVALIIFTDFCTDPLSRYNLGWLYIMQLLVFIFLSIFNMSRPIFRKICIYNKKYAIRAQHKLKPYYDQRKEQLKKKHQEYLEFFYGPVPERDTIPDGENSQFNILQFDQDDFLSNKSAREVSECHESIKDKILQAYKQLRQTKMTDIASQMLDTKSDYLEILYNSDLFDIEKVLLFYQVQAVENLKRKFFESIKKEEFKTNQFISELSELKQRFDKHFDKYCIKSGFTKFNIEDYTLSISLEKMYDWDFICQVILHQTKKLSKTKMSFITNIYPYQFFDIRYPQNLITQFKNQYLAKFDQNMKQVNMFVLISSMNVRDKDYWTPEKLNEIMLMNNEQLQEYLRLNFKEKNADDKRKVEMLFKLLNAQSDIFNSYQQFDQQKMLKDNIDTYIWKKISEIRCGDFKAKVK